MKGQVVISSKKLSNDLLVEVAKRCLIALHSDECTPGWIQAAIRAAEAVRGIPDNEELANAQSALADVLSEFECDTSKNS